jgi:hypothetical protein
MPMKIVAEMHNNMPMKIVSKNFTTKLRELLQTTKDDPYGWEAVAIFTAHHAVALAELVEANERLKWREHDPRCVSWAGGRCDCGHDDLEKAIAKLNQP